MGIVSPAWMILKDTQPLPASLPQTVIDESVSMVQSKLGDVDQQKVIESGKDGKFSKVTVCSRHTKKVSGLATRHFLYKVFSKA